MTTLSDLLHDFQVSDVKLAIFEKNTDKQNVDEFVYGGIYDEIELDETYFRTFKEDLDFSSVGLTLSRVVYIRKSSSMPRGRDMYFTVTGLPMGQKVELALSHSSPTLALDLPYICDSRPCWRDGHSFGNGETFVVRAFGTGLFDLCLYRQQSRPLRASNEWRSEDLVFQRDFGVMANVFAPDFKHLFLENLDLCIDGFSDFPDLIVHMSDETGCQRTLLVTKRDMRTFTKSGRLSEIIHWGDIRSMRVKGKFIQTTLRHGARFDFSCPHKTFIVYVIRKYLERYLQNNCPASALIKLDQFGF